MANTRPTRNSNLPHPFKRRRKELNQFSPARVAGSYLVAGLVWIGLSELAIAWLGEFAEFGYPSSVGKGVGFAIVSSVIVFSLCRREYRNTQLAAALLHAVVESTTDAIYVKDRDGKHLLVNDAAAQFVGRPVADILGCDAYDLFDLDDAKRLVEIDSAIMLGGKAVTIEETLTAAGVSRIFLATKAPYLDTKGQVIGLIGISRDITERKEIETTLRETEGRLRDAQRIARIGSWNWEPQSDKVWWSDAEFELFGADPAVIRPSLESFLSLLHPEDRSIAIARVDAMLAGADEFASDLRIFRLDGQALWIHSKARATRDADGRILKVEGTDQDVTDRREAEETLKASELQYRLLFEANPHPMWVYNIDTLKFLAVNDAAVMSYGYSRDEFLSMTLRDIRPFEDIKRLDETIAGLSPGPTPLSPWRHRRKDGTVFDVEVSSHDLLDKNSRLVLALDVTDRRRAERELREERDRFEKIMEAVPLAICSFHLRADGTVTMPYASPRIESIYGIPTSSLAIDASQIFKLIHPEDIKGIQESISESARTLTLWREEFRVQKPQSEEIWLEGCSIPVRLPDGTILWHGYVNDITSRKRADNTLRESERQLRLALVAAGAIAFVWDVKTDTVTRCFSREPSLPVTIEQSGNLEEVRSKIHPDDRADFDRRLAECLADGTEYRNEYRVVRNDGTTASLEDHGYLDRGADGSPIRLTGMSIDITDRRQLEAQFLQAQKMEAVGRLAGGIAHDFNNLLTVINGYADILLAEVQVDSFFHGPLTCILDAGERAARLTQQLLAFSRKSVVKPRLVDLNKHVAESTKILDRLIGEDIALKVQVDSAPTCVIIDPGQLEQVLMNLAVNARDAMPTGGSLRIETGVVEVKSMPNAPDTNLRRGRFASIRVTDTGCGMKPEIQDKIFEPFYTTKGVGKGTGLGLSVVHGIVQQAGGWIEVESLENAGTSFNVMLPLEAINEDREASCTTCFAPSRGETVLVVEDEDEVRKLVRVALESQGYNVLSASSGKSALDLLNAHNGEVDIMVTDVIMPGINGRELAEIAFKKRPEMRVLYMSGYTDEALDRHGLQEAEVQFIQKPFSPTVFVKQIREMLDKT